MSRSARGTIGSALVGAAVTAAVQRLLDARGAERRTNYRGSTVTLSAGPAIAAGMLAALAGRRGVAGASIAVAGAALAGAYDDRASALEVERRVKGFSGHLGALADGRASAGAVKIAVIGTSSLAGAFLRTGASVDTVVDGALVAGSANLANLLDLRPGRALKVAALVSLACTPGARGPAGTLIGASYGTLAVTLPVDLAERSMLGDTGANAVGALAGSIVCARSRPVRLAALTIVVGLTALSEKVSFTRVIAASPPLRWLDELGRAGG